VFIHPNTGQDLEDHRDRAVWIGKSVPLALDIFTKKKDGRMDSLLPLAKKVARTLRTGSNDRVANMRAFAAEALKLMDEQLS